MRVDMLLSLVMLTSLRLLQAQVPTDCSLHFFERPLKPLTDPMLHNGQAIRDVCFGESASRHVIIIGDWGGVQYTEKMPIMPADHRSHLFPKRARKFIAGVDNFAQQRVAAMMVNLSMYEPPDYVLNVGDNFYWGGANSSCNANAFNTGFSWNQWGPIFELMYRGGGLDRKQWLGVLGNHDYGGFAFTSGWHESIFYTWAEGESSTGRWFTPAQFWKVKVRYVDFSVDYYFVDNNVNNAWEVNASTAHLDGHNICSKSHNSPTDACSITGPASLKACHSWFESLWETQTRWIPDSLAESVADWQIVVSHFPPEYNAEFWTRMGTRYGIDLIISGHRHFQNVTLPGETTKTAPAFPFTTVISGGGGGITSDCMPKLNGDDDAYGFMDMFLNRYSIHLRAFSHTGILRRSVDVAPVDAQDLKSPKKEFLASHQI